MAILQALKVSSGTEQMPGIGDGQSAKTVASSYVFAAAPANADVIQSALIQAGSVITDVQVILSGFGTSSSISVGYGGDTAYFNAASSGVAAQVLRKAVGNIPLVLATNDTVDVTIIAAGATATGTVTIVVNFLPRNA